MNNYSTTGLNNWAFLNIGDHFPPTESLFWEDCFFGAVDAPDWIPAGSIRCDQTIKLIEISVISRG